MTTTALAPRQAGALALRPARQPRPLHPRRQLDSDARPPRRSTSSRSRFRETNDLDAARRLVLAHLRFVVHVARGYAGYGLPLGDLIQEGNVGLMKAVKRFDPNVGVRLVSFAVHWIRAEIHEYVLRNWRLVKVATTKAQRKLFFNLRKAKKHLGWLSRDGDRGGRQGPRRQHARSQRDGAAAQQLRRLVRPRSDGRRGLRARRVSAEPRTATRPRRSSARTGTRTRTIVSTPRSRSSTRAAATSSRAAGSRTTRPTLHELAAEYDVSAERIRQIEANAIAKLRAQMVTA